MTRSRARGPFNQFLSTIATMILAWCALSIQLSGRRSEGGGEVARVDGRGGRDHAWAIAPSGRERREGVRSMRVATKEKS